MHFEGMLVNSTLVRLIAYNETGILRLIFNDGRGYEYINIPRRIYDLIIESNSIGQAYWKYVRANFKYNRKLEKAEALKMLNLFIIQQQKQQLIINYDDI
jgi:hypothetical protein